MGKTKTIPYILAGDFNILPDSPHYKLLTTGELDKSDATYPPSKHGENWTIQCLPMDSAYAMKDTAEPEFTNYAHCREDPDPFIGTLDYIFLSQKDISVQKGLFRLMIRSCLKQITKKKLKNESYR